MPLYDGSPLIKIEGNKAKAFGRIPDAKLLLQKTQRVAENAGVSTFSMSQRTDEGYMFALTANGVNRIFISSNPNVVDQEEESTNDPLEKSFVNMLSGTVFQGSISGNVLSTFAPTAQCRRNYPGMPSGRQGSVRLAVQPWSGNDETQVGGADSQYTNLKPSMYSGKMCAVVQAVMGLGRIRISKLSDTPVGANSNNTPKYLKEVKANGVQIRYDYKFHRTHGIYTGADGVLWLVEIGINRGILARPLPIVPKSRSNAFRDSAAARSDSDLLAVYDELGCFPSGEAFPNTPTELQQAIDRGDVLRLMPADGLKDFYKNSPYSTACGWAFSDDGSEAHNTAYGYESDSAVTQTGYHYQINISIGAMQTPRIRNTPISTGSASLIIQSKAPLYGAGRIGKFLPIKFHEPLIGGLLSHDASPKEATTPPLCDTTMMVCFDEGQLKTVKFYFNPATDLVSEVEDSRYPGECLYAGEWSIVEKSGTRSIPRMMYTNDIDDRRTRVDYVRETNIKSRDLGFDPPQFSDFLESPEFCAVFRYRVFEKTTKIVATSGDNLGSVVIIPQGSRSAYYYMFASSTQEVITMDFKEYDYIQDPNVAYGWRSFPRISLPPISAECINNRFLCGTTHTDRRVICLSYEPGFYPGFGGVDGNCYQYADYGLWIKECDPIEVVCSAQMNNAFPVRHGSSSTTYKGPTRKTTLTLVSPGVGGQLTIPTPVDNFSLWERPSPDPDTLEIQHISSSHSSLGEDALVYYTDLIGSGTQKFKGISAATIGASDNPTFIGVNGNG